MHRAAEAEAKLLAQPVVQDALNKSRAETDPAMARTNKHWRRLISMEQEVRRLQGADRKAQFEDRINREFARKLGLVQEQLKVTQNQLNDAQAKLIVAARGQKEVSVQLRRWESWWSRVSVKLPAAGWALLRKAARKPPPSSDAGWGGGQ